MAKLINVDMYGFTAGNLTTRGLVVIDRYPIQGGLGDAEAFGYLPLTIDSKCMANLKIFHVDGTFAGEATLTGHKDSSGDITWKSSGSKLVTPDDAVIGITASHATFPDAGMVISEAKQAVLAAKSDKRLRFKLDIAVNGNIGSRASGSAGAFSGHGSVEMTWESTYTNV